MARTNNEEKSKTFVNNAENLRANGLSFQILLFISALICGFASICLAVCIALEVKEQLRWVASVLLLLHVFFASLGLYPLIFLLPREMLATKVCKNEELSKRRPIFPNRPFIVIFLLQLRITLTSVSWGISWLMTFILIQVSYNSYCERLISYIVMTCISIRKVFPVF